MVESTPIGIELKAKIAKRIEQWRNELVDLTRVNRLIYYKQSTKALALRAPDVFTLADQLDADGKGWRFYEPPEPDAEGGVEDAPPPERALDGFIYTQERSPKRLRTRLKALKQKAHEALEERGVHILYMAAGALYWTDGDSSEELHCSPLILFPVKLEQKTRTEPFVLMPVADEEIIENPSLQEKLRRDLGFQLPDLPTADQIDRTDGDDLCRQYFETVDASLTPEQRKRGWRVAPEARLDVFTFHKLVMYVDLQKNAARVQSHPIVTAMVGGRTAPEAFGPPVDGKRVDEQLLVRDACHVMDADGSQLAVLQAVRRGTSLVLQGPPGTGKSQTIANIISQSVAEGKTVLFVSEKMEALEVVYSRLVDAGLKDLCLQLHSHKANKKVVIAELARRMQEQLTAKIHIDADALEKLDARRATLNEYVHELHLARSPLGHTIHHVLGQLAQLAHLRLPPVPQHERSVVERLNGAQWQEIQDDAKVIAGVWNAAVAPQKLTWLGAKPVMLDTQTGAEIAAELDALTNTARELRTAGAALAIGLGWQAPESPVRAKAATAYATQMSESPGVPESFFDFPIAQLKASLDDAHSKVGKIAAIRERVGSAVSDAAALSAPAMRALGVDLQAALVGWQGDEVTISVARNLERGLRELADAAAVACQTAERLTTLLGLMDTPTLQNVERMRWIGERCCEETLVPPSLFDPALLAQARAALPVRKALWREAQEALAEVEDVAEAPLLELDINALLADYRTRYDGVLRVFKPAFWKSERTIKAQLKNNGSHMPRTTLLECAKRAKDRAQDVEALRPQDEVLFGSLARGHETDVDVLERAIVASKALLDSIDVRPLPVALVGALTCGGLVSSSLRSAVNGLQQARDRVDLSLKRLQLPAEVVLVQLGGPLREVRLDDVVSWARSTHAALTRSSSDVRQIPAEAGELTLSKYASLLELHEKGRALEAELARGKPQLLSYFGEAYRDESTAWDDVHAALTFAQRLQDAPGGFVTAQVRAAVAHAAPTIPGLRDAQCAVAGFFEAEAKLARRFTAGTATATGAAVRDQRYAELFGSVERLATNKHEIDELARIAYAKARLRALGLGDTVEAVLAHQGVSEQFGQRLNGTLFQCWLDRVIAAIPILHQFKADEHEKRAKEFAELDRSMWSNGAHRVIVGFNRSQPEQELRTQEHIVLQQQAARSRKIMPLRRLFMEVSSLIPRLKPCLMMSPISVAQFLADSEMTFDLVVFDEASQITPEDAVGAITRGRQVIVCGDPKQLPPTAFFTKSFLDGDDEYDEQDTAVDAASILEECDGAGLSKLSLQWHYRSKHQNLIEYSNQNFYESKLITFPNRIAESEELGVKFVYVADGVYDRGKSCTNRVEAERVAELVIQHWRQWGQRKTLAVVTLSAAQQSAVHAAIETKLESNRDLEGYYRDEGKKPFRVKNLENVQGDERDVIIVSIGYGPDINGKLSRNFGPINQAAGSRRLNVLITRAEQKLVIVASFRAADVPVEEKSQEGVRHLIRFMGYAEHGPKVLQTSDVGNGDFESPLESSIASAVRELGYDVVPQVGCGGYRIDLGVRHPNHPGAFLLGIECDGAQYHSSVTARDRDRLRQHVLENLGWTIHRVRGPDWIRARPRELERIRGALDAVFKHKPIEMAVAKVERVPLGKTESSAPVDLKTSDARPKWAQVFVPAEPRRLGIQGSSNITDLSTSELARHMAAIAVAENGVHFERAAQIILDACGVKRLGSNIRAHLLGSRRAVPSTFHQEDDFIYPPSYIPRVLVWDGAGERRDLDTIPPRELELAMDNILAGVGGMAATELIDHLARLYGVRRVTEQSRDALGKVLTNACKSGRFASDGQRVTRVRG